MAKQAVNVEDLPTLDDFQESKLLTQKDVEEPSEEEEEEEEEEEQDDKNKKPEPKPEVKNQDKDKDKNKPAKEQKEKSAPEKQPKGQPGPKDTKGKPAPVPAQEPEPEPESDDEGNFWTDVEKITGIQLDVDFGEVDPETPQGAAIREQALVEYAVESYIKTLQEKFPRAYKILEHEANGGRVEDLLTPDYVDYSKVELKEENKEQQKQVLLDFYKSKGFDAKKAQRMVDADEDSEEGLFAQAKAALAERAQAQKAEEERITKEAKLKQQAREQQDAQFLGGVKKVVDSGKLGNFTIAAKKDREDFFSFIQENVQRADDGYVAVLNIDKQNPLEALQQLFFAFRKGKLDEFINARAETQTVRRLERKVKGAEKLNSEQSPEQKKVKELPTFDDYKVD